ncbi:hypothetical protein [Polymorphospora lycopeni]|uniref:Uncharacterized protein n=1 Tax=Polymorphospora lycopeni TaxID=3140240 RepID=A0ABV5D2H8_9ACTN
MSGSLRRSPHVVYTRTYDALAHAFVFGDSRVAIMSAAHLDERSVNQFLARHVNWPGALSFLWAEWITLCCLAKAHSAWCHVGFSKKSVVNQDHFGSIDAKAVKGALKAIESKSQLPAQRREVVNRLVRARVERRIRQGEGAYLVPGEWFAEYLSNLLSIFFAGFPVGLKDFSVRASVAFVDALDYSGSWADYYRDRFEAVI